MQSEWTVVNQSDQGADYEGSLSPNHLLRLGVITSEIMSAIVNQPNNAPLAKFAQTRPRILHKMLDVEVSSEIIQAVIPMGSRRYISDNR
jgi:hypothetical protein